VPLALEKSETYLWLFSAPRRELDRNTSSSSGPSLVSFDSWETPVAPHADVFENFAAWGSRYPNTTQGCEEARTTLARYARARRDGREVTSAGNAIRHLGLG